MCQDNPNNDIVFFCETHLSAGNQTITVEVFGEEGSTESELTLHVENKKTPDSEIVFPLADRQMFANSTVQLEGGLETIKTNPLNFQYTWLSTRDGHLASGTVDKKGDAEAQVKLSPGQHTITLIIEDTDGLTSRQSIHTNVISSKHAESFSEILAEIETPFSEEVERVYQRLGGGPLF